MDVRVSHGLCPAFCPGSVLATVLLCGDLRMDGKDLWQIKEDLYEGKRRLWV